MPPRGWSGAGVGVGMLRGAGDFPYLNILVSWFLVFLVSWFAASWFLASWFLGSLVSNFLGFKASWFLGFKISKFQRFNDPMLPNSHLMFLVNIDLISKILKILLNGSSGLFVPHLFHK